MVSLIKKEIYEHVISSKGTWIFFIISLLFSGLSFSFISVKELSFLAQVEVTMTFIKVFLAISIFIAIILGSSTLSMEKEKGTLESLLLSPLSKIQILVAKLLAIFTFWLILTLISLPYLFALTSGTHLFLSILLYIYFVGIPLVMSFAGMSIVISSWIKSTKNVMMFSLILFIITTIPIFLSTTMKKVGFAYLMDRMSPVSSSLLALKDLLVNKVGTIQILLDMIPISILMVVIIGGMVFASKKFNFLGGE